MVFLGGERESGVHRKDCIVAWRCFRNGLALSAVVAVTTDHAGRSAPVPSWASRQDAIRTRMVTAGMLEPHELLVGRMWLQVVVVGRTGDLHNLVETSRSFESQVQMFSDAETDRIG